MQLQSSSLWAKLLGASSLLVPKVYNCFWREDQDPIPCLPQAGLGQCVSGLVRGSWDSPQVSLMLPDNSYHFCPLMVWLCSCVPSPPSQQQVLHCMSPPNLHKVQHWERCRKGWPGRSLASLGAQCRGHGQLSDVLCFPFFS